MTMMLRLIAAAAALAGLASAQQNGGIAPDGRGSFIGFADFAGCVPKPDYSATYCIFPTTGARFVVGQRFEARVEVHTGYNVTDGTALAPYATAPRVSLSLLINGSPANAIDIASPALSATGVAASPVTAAGYPFWTTTYIDAAGAPIPAAPLTRFSYGTTWKGLAAPAAVGKHAVVLTVDGVEQARVTWTVVPPAPRTAKNVILFIGDGMNTGIVTAARLLSRGMAAGKYNGELAMDGMSRLGFVSTNGYDSLITDSANSASAYATGHKAPVNALGVYGDSTGSPADDPRVELITEMAARKYGNARFGVGIVTTSEIQDATPAAFFAHTRKRDEKAEITRQFLEGSPDFTDRLELDVLLGGGGAYFYPKTMLQRTDAASGALLWCKVAPTAGACPAGQTTVNASESAGPWPAQSSNGGASLGGRNFYAEAAAAGYAVVHNASALAAASTRNGKLLGIFAAGNMDTWLDRHLKPGNLAPANSPLYTATPAAYAARAAPVDQPDLTAMTDAALKVLARRSEDGFFLMVEGASIDKAEHPYDSERAVSELIDMDNAIGVALEFARARGDTLVLATADHGHAFDVFGTVDTKVFDAMDAQTASPAAKKTLRQSAVGLYQKAGFPDVVDTDGDGHPDNWATARYTLAVGYGDTTSMKENYRLKDAVRSPFLADPNAADTGTPAGNNHGLSFSRNMPSTQGVHTLQDVPLYAEGPGSAAVRAHQENVDVARIIASALGLGGSPAGYAPAL